MLEADNYFEVAGRSLAATLYSPLGEPARRPNRIAAGVLFVHGFTQNRQLHASTAQLLAERCGAVSLTLDLGGHGDSAGDLSSVTINDHLAEITGAYRLLLEQPLVDQTRTALVANSFGGYLVALLAARLQPALIVLQAPALYADSIIPTPRRSMDWAAQLSFRANLEPPAPNQAMAALASYGGKLVVVESGHEEYHSPAIAEAYASCVADSQHEIIVGASHTLRGCYLKEFQKILIEHVGNL